MEVAYERSGLSRSLADLTRVSHRRRRGGHREGRQLQVPQGEFVTVIGHSGCGKSTILMIVAGLSTATTGGIILAGKDEGPGPDRGVVFQAPSLLPWMTALENVMLGVNQVFYTAET